MVAAAAKGRKSFVQLAILYSGDLIVQDVDPFAQVEQSFQEPQSRFNESSTANASGHQTKGCCRVDRVSRTGRCGLAQKATDPGFGIRHVWAGEFCFVLRHKDADPVCV